MSALGPTPATYSLAEAGAILGISKTTAYELYRNGRFPVPVLTVGTRKKVSRRALEAFIDGPQEQAS